jgi:DNA-binding NtrC family response regulator
LQEKEYRPVGGLAQRSSDFRVIAATKRDLASEVQKGSFREDLYYRLNVISLRLPPLRERKEDIPLLIDYFLVRYGNGHRVPTDIMDTLIHYEWPGNVRQLEHTVQQMVAMNSGQWISQADLPSTVSNVEQQRDFERNNSPPGPLSPSATRAGSSYENVTRQVIPLAEVEKCAILHAMEITKGDRTLAAAMLDIGRTTLYRKLKDYGL